MIAPTVERLLPSTTGCVWSATSDGRVVCQTRSALHTAVLQATRLPGGDKRTAAVEAAMEAHAAHHCGPVGERASVDVGTRAGFSAGPVDRIDTDHLHQACVDAAISYGMRVERRMHAEGNADVDAALDRLTEAHTAYHRAMDRYNPQGVSHASV